MEGTLKPKQYARLSREVILSVILLSFLKTLAVHQIHGYLILGPKLYNRQSKEIKYKIKTIYTM